MPSVSTHKISRSKVFFFYEAANPGLKKRIRLKKFVQEIFVHEGKKLGYLNYVFCTDKKILEINRRFLKHDFYTDIITFDLSEEPGKISGEVYISVDRVKDNAKRMGESFTSEIHRVIFHGALHLCGYRDKNLIDTRKMRQKENQYLSLYGTNVSQNTVSRRNSAP